MPSQQLSGLTSSLSYTVRTTEHLRRVDPTQREPCTLAAAAIAAGLHLVFPCFCFIHYAEYLRHYEDGLARALRRAHAPHVLLPCAAIVAGVFTRFVLHPAGAGHRCPTGSFTPAHHVDILVQPRVRRAPPTHAAVDRAILESFEEARARTKTKPASRRAVVDLLIARAEEEVESGWSGECVICMDQIDRQAAGVAPLKLPCSHVFHKTCLVRWFQTNHVCPLCRYQMPTHD